MLVPNRTPLTLHAVQAEDEADEAFQWHVSGGGAVAHDHQTEDVVADHLSWSSTGTRQELKTAHYNLHHIILRPPSESIQVSYLQLPLLLETLQLKNEKKEMTICDTRETNSS